MTRGAWSEPARPLEPSVRSRMEARLGQDFSSVRLQEGPHALALHARAFAVGEHVVFAPGQYAPETRAGADLLAHELGHVVDHRRGGGRGIYRAPEGQQLPAGPERPYTPPRALLPDVGLGSLTLGLGTLDEFAFNGSTLTDLHRKQIPELASRILTMLVSDPGGRVTVTGNTDLVGGEQSNLELGHKRAREVAAALITAGVPASSIEATSAGESVPVVLTEKAEGRNRRVEVRFAGAPIGQGAPEPRLRLGPPEPPPKYDYKPSFPPPIFIPPEPGKAPPFPPAPTPGKQPAGQQPGPYDPGKPEPQPKAGSPGDVAKAVAALPAVKKLLDDAAAKAEKDFGNLSTPNKAVLGTVGGAIAAGVVAGIASDPAARKGVLDLIDGQEIPVPGLKGVSIVPHTKGGAGAGLSFDIIKIFGGGK